MATVRLARAGALAALSVALSCHFIAGLDKSFETVPCLDDCVDAASSDRTDIQDDGGGDVSFCATKDASLCWSFDEPPYVTGPGLVSRGPSGAATITSNAPKSPPYALEVSFKAGVFVGLDHQQVLARDHVTCAFDVRIDSFGATDIIIMELHGPSSGINRINVVAQSNEVSFRLATIQPGVPPLRQIGIHPLATWVHVVLDVNGLEATGTVEDSMNSASLDPDAGPWTVDEVSFGASTQENPSEWHVSYDNFYCTGF
jgi:hypothetical protein